MTEQSYKVGKLKRFKVLYVQTIFVRMLVINTYFYKKRNIGMVHAVLFTFVYFLPTKRYRKCRRQKFFRGNIGERVKVFLQRLTQDSRPDYYIV